jgi:hypothetical protein
VERMARVRRLLPKRLLLNSVSVSGERGRLPSVSGMGLRFGITLPRVEVMSRAKVRSMVKRVNFILKVYDLDVGRLGEKISSVEKLEIIM